MTLDQMLAAAEERLSQALATRKTKDTALRGLQDKDNFTEADVAEAKAARDKADADVDTARARVDDIKTDIAREAELDELAKRTETSAKRPVGGARVTSEPEVYRKGDHQISYFRDLYRAQHRNDAAASDRLTRNDKVVSGQMQERMLNSTSDTAGGYWVPPLWLVDQFVQLARPGRVFADQISHQTLPSGTDSISLPTLATGTAVAEQATQNTGVQETDAVLGTVSAAVTTIAGQQRISQQLIDQSPINVDDVILSDLAADYAVKLDLYALTKASIGILNVSGINAVTYTDASPTPGELYAKLADAIQQIHTQRFLPPTKIFMHPRRWAWFLAALDGSTPGTGRPLIVPAAGAYNALAEQNGVISQGLVGNIMGLPVYTDPSIPTNLGAGTNEDRIIVARAEDVWLYEGTPRAETSIHPGFGTLTVGVRFYNYAAFLGSRFPKSISVIAGTGLITPTF